jgi:hypothetical protein
MIRLATYFESMMERLANAERALSKAFDREDLKPGDQCAEPVGQRSQVSELRTPQEADCHRAEDLKRGKSAP